MTRDVFLAICSGVGAMVGAAQVGIASAGAAEAIGPEATIILSIVLAVANAGVGAVLGALKAPPKP